MAAESSLNSDLERKKNLIETLYHHSDLSVKAIFYQADMDVKQVWNVIDKIRKEDALEVLVEQSKTPVEDIMTTDVISLGHNKTVYDASVLMSMKNVGCVIVTANGKPYGIITERDIVRGIPSVDISLKNITLEEFASRPIISATPKQTVEEVADIMIREKIRRIPIIQNGNLVGIVTVTDLARFLSPTRRPGFAQAILQSISRNRDSKGI